MDNLKVVFSRGKIILIMIFIILMVKRNAYADEVTPTTTIDVTADTGSNGVVSHTHKWEQKYSKNAKGSLYSGACSDNPVGYQDKMAGHWEECFFCGYVRNFEEHTITMDGDPTAEKYCYYAITNVVEKCSDGCGYAYTYPKPSCVKQSYELGHYGKCWYDRPIHMTARCANCGNAGWSERCKDKDGNILGCDTENAGTCVGCGRTYSTKHNYIDLYSPFASANGWQSKTVTYTAKCDTCGTGLFQYTTTAEVVSETALKYELVIDKCENSTTKYFTGFTSSDIYAKNKKNIKTGEYKDKTVNNGNVVAWALYTETKDISLEDYIEQYDLQPEDIYYTFTVNSYTNGDEQMTRNYTMEYGLAATTSQNWNANTGSVINIGTWDSLDEAKNVNGNSANYNRGTVYFRFRTQVIDNIAPRVKSTNISYNNKVVYNGITYATQAKITVNMEDFGSNSNLVYVQLYDSDKKTILQSWKAATHESYSSEWKCTFDITAETQEPKTFYIQTKDARGNTSALTEVTISYLDNLAPRLADVKTITPTVTKDLGTATSSTTEWSQYKDVTYYFKDLGSGDVKIGYNYESDYKKANMSGTLFYRTFHFVGDVYGVRNAFIYVKDGIGNYRAVKVAVYNIDNTKPTITDVTDTLLSGKIVMTVSGHDENAKLKEASLKGAGYQYVGSGIQYYAMTTENTAPDSGWQTSSIFTINESGTYYFWAKDAAGNISESVRRSVYYVNFDKNKPETATRDVVGTMNSVIFVYNPDNSTYTLPENQYKLAGWVFTGWNTQADGSGRAFTDKAIMDEWTTNTQPLYAQWKSIGAVLKENSDDWEGLKLIMKKNAYQLGIDEETYEISTLNGEPLEADDENFVYTDVTDTNFKDITVTAEDFKEYIKDPVSWYGLKAGDIYTTIDSDGNKTAHKFIGWSVYKYATLSQSPQIIHEEGTNENMLDLIYEYQALKALGYNDQSNPGKSLISARADEILAKKTQMLDNAEDLTDLNIVLYAVWDEYPVMNIGNVGIMSGNFKDIDDVDDFKEVLMKAVYNADVYDREDGNWDDGANTDVEVIVDETTLVNTYELLNEKYNSAVSEGNVYSTTGSGSVKLTVADKNGNTTTHMIDVWMIASNPVLSDYNSGDDTSSSVFKSVTSYVRFISREFYNKDETEGGLVTNSLWRIEEDYKSELEKTFDILDNDDGWEQVWVFNADDVKEVQQYVTDNGLGNSQSQDALKNFYNKFSTTCRIQ